jgi:hypothetical protein
MGWFSLADEGGEGKAGRTGMAYFHTEVVIAQAANKVTKSQKLVLHMKGK